MNVSNQKPVELSPVHLPKPSGQMNPPNYLSDTIVKPLFNPLVAGSPVSITDNGAAVTDAQIVQTVINCCCDAQDAAAESWAKELYRKTLVYYDPSPNMNVRGLFAVQSGVKEKLRLPSPVVIYTPATDVIPSAKEFLAGKCTYDAFFASLAFYAKPNTLGFYFMNEQAFDQFKAALSTTAQTLAAVLPPATNQLIQDFLLNIKLSGLTESILLRANDSEGNDEYSFARIIMFCLMQHVSQSTNGLYGVLPFDIAELYCPRSIVFVNVEKHAQATPKQVADEWDLINQSIRMKCTVLNNQQITKLTAVSRAMQKIQQAAAAAGQPNMTGRHVSMKFRTRPPDGKDLTKSLIKLITHMAYVAKSENQFKAVKTSYQKPNRRNPDDFNKPGKIVSVKYKPDIHIYLDTSGSISEENYKSAIMACIRIAKKLNINLYFNSFSSVMSVCTKLHLKDRSTKQIYASFQAIPKVSGGTDYEQIWDYIQRSPKRKRELSLVITDFEYLPPSYNVDHPKNIYYAPIGGCSWNHILGYIKHFCANMRHIDPAIRAKVIC